MAEADRGGVVNVVAGTIVLSLLLSMVAAMVVDFWELYRDAQHEALLDELWGDDA